MSALTWVCEWRQNGRVWFVGTLSECRRAAGSNSYVVVRRVRAGEVVR